MTTSKRRLIAVLTFCILAVSPISCRVSSDYLIERLNSYYELVTLEKANELVGVVVPVPTHLPDDYVIQEVYVLPRGTPPRLTYEVILLISDEEVAKKPITYVDRLGTHQALEVQCRMTMAISWRPYEGPDIMAEGKRVDINGSKGVILDDAEMTYKIFEWDWQPDPGQTGKFRFKIQAPKMILDEELIRVAESAQY